MIRRRRETSKGGGRRDGSPPTGEPVFRLLQVDADEAAARRKETLEKARRQVEAFPELTERLLTLMRSVYPPHVIAVLAGWGLRAGLGPDGVSTRSMIPGLEQHHVELLQALVLTLPWDSWGREPADPSDIQQALDTVRELTDAFHGRRVLAAERPLEPAAAALLGLQERLRAHTQIVRNWGYYGEVLRICRALYGPLDERLRRHHGFDATQMIAVIDAITRVVDDQVNDRFRTLKLIFRARSIRQLVRLFFERYPGVQGDPHAFLDSLDPAETMASVKFRLLTHADRWLLVCSTAPVAKVAALAAVPEATAAVIMDRLSYEPGALTGQTPEHLFMANPVWTRPGLKTGTDYFFAFPQTAASFIHDILRAAIEEAGLADALQTRRKTFLEAETARLVGVALPGAVLTPGAKWRWEEQPFETDVLAVLDRTVVIAEAKSAALTAHGLRGKPERVKRHIRDLVVDPSRQSARLEEIIWWAKAGETAAVSVAASLGLDPTGIDTVVRLSVTLDDFSVLCSAEGELKQAGLAPADLDLAPTLNVADFACAVDLLGPAYFLYCFAERRRFQKRVNLVADELDLLGFYLRTAFNLNGQPEVRNVGMTGMSVELDRYYTSRDAGVVLHKPAPRRGVVIADVIDALQARRPAGWTTAALDLLRSASHDEQGKIRRALDDLRRAVPRTYRNPEHDNAVLWTPSDPTDAVVLFYVFPRALETQRWQTIERLAAHALHTTGRPRCVFIGRMVEEGSRPYHLVGVAYADGAEST